MIVLCFDENDSNLDFALKINRRKQRSYFKHRSNLKGLGQNNMFNDLCKKVRNRQRYIFADETEVELQNFVSDVHKDIL